MEWVAAGFGVLLGVLWWTGTRRPARQVAEIQRTLQSRFGERVRAHIGHGFAVPFRGVNATVDVEFRVGELQEVNGKTVVMVSHLTVLGSSRSDPRRGADLEKAMFLEVASILEVQPG